ncbi:hypothetical protein OG21DRAFT_1460872 [Imleria badia]|nr:hypothetical protein OG21DRAFT_1460872 [Imleria badia]
MAIIPLFRFVIFLLITIFSLVVLGISAHIMYLISGFVDVYSSFAPFGLGVSCVTIIALPLFLALGNLRRRVFTSMILFEIIWFFILWILWVGVAGDTVAGKAWYYPEGCVFNDCRPMIHPEANQICNEVTVLEAFAFLNFFCAFIYYDVIFLYAIINTIRGRGIWTASVREATTGAPGTGLPVVQPQFNAAPVTQNYGTYPSNTPPAQPYNAYPQQGSPAQPYTAYPQQAPPQGQGPPQQYNAYPQQAPPQGPPPQQYSAYPPQAPQGFPTGPPAQNQPYNYPSAPGAPQQQVNYGYSPSPTGNNTSLPPQPNYDSYPADGSQAFAPTA